LESRKYQLQEQIIEALKANDDDLYSLLKSQWAHRFGVESLEELKNLELNQNSTNVNSQKIDESQEKSSEVVKSISRIEDNNSEKEIKNKELDSIVDENSLDQKIKSDGVIDKENNENKAIKTVKENKNLHVFEALIPLPPKPKYSYLKKWLLRN
tara:strand:+ start:62 stop:526 length:465 start_codon:yes stop_codon:yes gene_type:complete